MMNARAAAMNFDCLMGCLTRLQTMTEKSAD
jgi:hypothetical protein